VAGLTPDVQEGIAALERVLTLDPENKPAQQGLDSLKARAGVQHEPTTSTTPPAADQPAETSVPDAILAARAVIWPFRSLNRPIGELLDDGQIDKNDLMYAARQAFDPQVRQAAATLLGDHAPREMSLQEARAVVWSFGQVKGPLGALLDSGQIDRHSLHWAARKAYDPRVRQAASLLLASFVEPAGQPVEVTAEVTPAQKETEPAAGTPLTSPGDTLRVVLGDDFISRQEASRQQKAVRLVIPIIGLWLVSMVMALGAIAASLMQWLGWIEWNLPSWIGPAALVMILAACALVPVCERLLDERDQYRLGRDGEERTVAALGEHFDGQWQLFRNLVLPGSQADIDGVLVGPPGVYALEIKSYNGHFRHRGNTWQRRRQGAWRRLSRNPSAQARANAMHLSRYLEQATGEKLWVEPAVVWAGPGKLEIPGKPAVYVWFLSKMADRAAKLAAQPAMPQSRLAHIRQALERAGRPTDEAIRARRAT